eukprot:767259-Hanusia_phi.AAC.2
MVTSSTSPYSAAPPPPPPPAPAPPACVLGSTAICVELVPSEPSWAPDAPSWSPAEAAVGEASGDDLVDESALSSAGPALAVHRPLIDALTTC